MKEIKKTNHKLGFPIIDVGKKYKKIFINSSYRDNDNDFYFERLIYNDVRDFTFLLQDEERTCKLFVKADTSVVKENKLSQSIVISESLIVHAIEWRNKKPLINTITRFEIIDKEKRSLVAYNVEFLSFVEIIENKEYCLLINIGYKGL